MAFVVSVNCPVAALAAFSVHRCTAMTAEYLGCQKIVFFCLGSGRSFFVFLQFLLYSVKQILGNNGGYSVGNDHTLRRIFTYVAAVAQHMLNSSPRDSPTFGIGNALAFEITLYFGYCVSLVVLLKGFYHIGGGHFVNLQVLLLVHHITNGERAAVPLELIGIDS